ncbi:MAG: ribose-5-phosphate isomerase [Actinobacteria bacterium]|nr:ribose-5-phosphate isomerase [Actinomycetota bacterium]
MTRLHIAADHAGLDLKRVLSEHLSERGFDVVDHGSEVLDQDDDYPGCCAAAARSVVADPGSLGIVIGGSGNGEQIAANKVRGVRAALGWSPETARLARRHNDANVIGVGARMHSEADAIAIVDAFVDEPFSGEARHVRRIAQVAALEER